MLKFIPQNEKNYENSAKSELGIDSNFLEFFSSAPNEIKEKINSTLSEVKSSKKGEVFYTKLVYYFSFLINSSIFKEDDKGKKVIQNLIEICESEVGSRIFQDLFYILTDEKHNLLLKKEILKLIPKSKIKFEENDFVQLYNLFILYLSDSNYDGEIISIFAELLEKNKNFILLKKLENSEKIRIIIKNEYSKDKSSIIGDINISKLYFFLILSSPDLVDEDLSEVILNEKLIEEKKLINNLENRKDADILFNYELQKYFDEAYGEKAAELILIGAKESSIHEILIGFSDEKQMTISFKDLIERIYEEDDEEKKIEFKDEDIQNKFEEIEDMIFSGKEHKLYNIVIDYMKKEIRILYLRRPEYTPEQKEELLKRVKDMKTKLQGILKAIEKI
jgi:hypothetical protein